MRGLTDKKPENGNMNSKTDPSEAKTCFESVIDRILAGNLSLTCKYSTTCCLVASDFQGLLQV